MSRFDRQRLAGPLAVAVLGLWLAGCAVGRPAASLVRTELIFGLSKSHGTTMEQIAEGEWQKFVEDTLAAEFPDGFSIVDATGQYMMKSSRIVRERSKIVLIVHSAEPASARAIDRVIAAYKKRFDQEDVLRITIPLAPP